MNRCHIVFVYRLSDLAEEEKKRFAEEGTNAIVNIFKKTGTHSDTVCIYAYM